MLDLLEAACDQRGYGCLRLDGNTAPAVRMGLVERFNDPTGAEREPILVSFVFFFVSA